MSGGPTAACWIVLNSPPPSTEAIACTCVASATPPIMAATSIVLDGIIHAAGDNCIEGAVLNVVEAAATDGGARGIDPDGVAHTARDGSDVREDAVGVGHSLIIRRAAVR